MPPMGDKCSVDLYVNCAFIQVAQIEAKMIQPIFIHKYIYSHYTDMRGRRHSQFSLHFLFGFDPINAEPYMCVVGCGWEV